VFQSLSTQSSRLLHPRCMHAYVMGARCLKVTTSRYLPACSGIGPVKQAFIVKSSGKTHKGFGFVQFALHEDAERAAKQANGVELGGRKMQVRVCVVCRVMGGELCQTASMSGRPLALHPSSKHTASPLPCLRISLVGGDCKEAAAHGRAQEAQGGTGRRPRGSQRSDSTSSSGGSGDDRG
jgi:hypothetical protein